MKRRLIWPVLATVIILLSVAWFVYPCYRRFGVFPPQFVDEAVRFNPLAFIVIGPIAVFITGLIWKLIWPVLATVIILLSVAWFVYPCHLPPEFGVFPPHFVDDALDLWAFIVIGLGAVYITGLILFPKLYGFKGAIPGPKPDKKPLPWWFYTGLAVNLFFWWLMWSHSELFGDLVYWSPIPICCGFIFVLDGIVYHRNNGVSLFSSKRKLLLISAIVSVGGWTYFAFYDYFVPVLGNWYYPNVWSHTILRIEFLVLYSTITPALFQWYLLLNTFPNLPARYKNGPKWKINGNVLLLIGAILIGAMVLLPYPVFWVMWIGPFAMMTGMLLNLKIWNPFKDIARGDWSAGVLIGVASLIHGFLVEFWNFGSHFFAPDSPTNPNYSVFKIPYVNVIHVFSEMSLVGYIGYIPFGILVWQVFIWSGKLFGFDTNIALDSNQVKDEGTVVCV